MKNNPLTSKELEKLQVILKNLEDEIYYGMFYHRTNGGFSNAKICGCDGKNISIELKFGSQDNTHSNVHIENYTVNRETMILKKKLFFTNNKRSIDITN